MKASRYFHIFRIQLKNNFVREAVYRSNFVTMVAVDLIWIVVEFSLFQVIYANTTAETTELGWLLGAMMTAQPYVLSVFVHALDRGRVAQIDRDLRRVARDLGQPPRVPVRSHQGEVSLPRRGER